MFSPAAIEREREGEHIYFANCQSPLVSLRKLIVAVWPGVLHTIVLVTQSFFQASYIYEITKRRQSFRDSKCLDVNILYSYNLFGCRVDSCLVDGYKVDSCNYA